jgi:hypothetical protein
MGPKLGHEAGGTSTVARIPPQNDGQCERDPRTHVDSTDPFRLLCGTKCSPFFPYHWLCTGALAIRARYSHCGPDNDQSDGECSMDVHG